LYNAGNIGGSHRSLYPGEDAPVTIGDHCLFSWGIIIRSTDNHRIWSRGDAEPKQCETNRPVGIGNNCWVCQDAKILKGSVIPNNSVVAMGALVSKKFSEENIVIGGNPARIVKHNIVWKY